MPAGDRKLKPSHVERIWEKFRGKGRGDIVNELRELIDTIERISTGRQGPVTDEEISAALPRLYKDLRECYLSTLEKAGHLTACYGGHDSRRTGWRLNPSPRDRPYQPQ